MIPVTHYLNVYWNAIASEAIDEGAPVAAIAGEKVANATATVTDVFVACQDATQTGDTSYYQNHITPTMKIGDPIEVMVSGIRTARVYGAVTFGADLIVDTTNKAFAVAPEANTAPVVATALFDDAETGLKLGAIKLR